MTTLTIPTWAKSHLTPHLYYKQFPYKVEVRCNRLFRDQKVQAQTVYNTITNWLATEAMPEDKKTYRMRQDWYTTSFFFKEPADVEALLKGVETVLGKHGKNACKFDIYTMSDEQAEQSALDAKLVFRKDLYHGKYTYRLESKGCDEATQEAIEAQFFTDEDKAAFQTKLEKEQAASNRRASRYYYSSAYKPVITKHGRSISNARARMTYGYDGSYGNTIVFTETEDDAAMARLLLSNAKVTKVVISK